jgi:branched-chain amino acid transport system permease protein
MVATLFASIVDPAILRLRGHYFAVASLVMAPVLRELVNSATGLTGWYGPQPAPARNRRHHARALLLLGHALACTWRCGRRHIAPAHQVRLLGIDTLLHKSVAFALSGLFTGLAGAIYATWIGYIDPTDV